MINVSWIALGVAVLAVGLAILFHLKQIKALKQVIEDLSEGKSNLEREHKILRHEIDEIRSGSIGIGQKLKQLQTWFQEMDERQSEMSLQDPESRLYTRAAKMAAKGASAQEIAEDCEIPLVEAELIVSLRKNT